MCGKVKRKMHGEVKLRGKAGARGAGMFRGIHVRRGNEGCGKWEEKGVNIISVL